MEKLSTEIPELSEIQIPNYTREEFEEMQIRLDNERTGNLKGYDCAVCRNKGYIYYLTPDRFRAVYECRCMKIRRVLYNAKKSGMYDLLKSKNFDNYQTSEGWQADLKTQCMQYAKNPDTWLYVSGQSGAGKTHLCTAVCNILLKQGKEVKYIMCKELFHKLEQNRFKEEEFSRLMDEIKNTEVVYFDDFLKMVDRDKLYKIMDTAFEIVNSRYNGNGITIFSSEFLISELAEIDEATAGRIAQKSKLIQIARKPERNYRMKDKLI